MAWFNPFKFIRTDSSSFVDCFFSMKVFTGAAALGFFAFFFSASSRLSIAFRRSANILFSMPLRLSCPERFSPPEILRFCFTRRSAPFLRSVVVRLSPPRLRSAIILTGSVAGGPSLSADPFVCGVGVSSCCICPTGFPLAFKSDASNGLSAVVGWSPCAGSVFSITSSSTVSISWDAVSTSSTSSVDFVVSSPIKVGSTSNFLAALMNLFWVIPLTISDSAIVNIPLDWSFLIW